MPQEPLARVHDHLSAGSTYPEGGPVEVRETHISVVFLTPTRAYKLLKPVRFDFLDFSTREARYAECWNEVRLNRRLASDVYLDVIPVTQSGENLALNGDGRAIDWVIQMRRLPDDATLEAKIRAGTAATTHLDRVLDALQPFFDRAMTGPEINDGGRTTTIRRNLVENFDVLDAQPATAIDAAVLRSLQLQFLATQQPLFDRRIADGWIRDVHGDLRAEHIYFTDRLESEVGGRRETESAIRNPQSAIRPDFRPLILDCIAFNNRFRHVDLLDEVCFLATDLRRLGRDDLAVEVVQRYRQRMNDPAPDALAGFFESYRFAVRAKVACLRAGAEGTSGRNDESARQAVELVGRAIDALRAFHRPCVIAFCGVSGSGKSTVARGLAGEIGGVHLRSDVVRKELHGVHAGESEVGGLRSEVSPHLTTPLTAHHSPLTTHDLYSAEATAATYNTIHHRAAEWLDRGTTVLLDATYRRAADRTAARQLARDRNMPFLLVHCQCSQQIAEERIRRRQQAGGDPSDADVAVLRRQLDDFDPPGEIPPGELVEMSTEQPVEAAVRLIVSSVPVV